MLWRRAVAKHEEEDHNCENEPRHEGLRVGTAWLLRSQWVVQLGVSTVVSEGVIGVGRNACEGAEHVGNLCKDIDAKVWDLTHIDCRGSSIQLFITNKFKSQIRL